MTRPVTLFTGQWADLPLAELAAKCGGWGFDGLELACWGDHFDVAEALRDPGYASGVRARLELACWGDHLDAPAEHRHRGFAPGVRALLERDGLPCRAVGQHLLGETDC